MQIVLANVSESSQTVTLTYLPSGSSTARQLGPALALGPGESAAVRNIPLEPSDALLGVADTAETVDYLIFSAPGGSFVVDVYDANGTGKGVSTLRKILLGIEHLTDGEMADPGT